VGRALRVGTRDVPLFSGAMHYWRLERDTWKRGLEEVRNLGLQIVETYAPWGVHETALGTFDFGERDPRKDLGAFLDLAAELELYAFVRPGPHINAEMTYFGLPERIVYDRACQARSPRQSPVILGFPPRMFPVPSYASDRFHDETARWYEAVGRVVAPRLWPRGNVVLLQVDNEAAYYFRDGPYCQDYHPDAVALWHSWLEQRHGSLAATAKAHHAEYASWDDVRPPERFRATTSEELVPHLEWAEFREVLITRALVRMRVAMTQGGLDGVPVAHNVPLGEGGLPISVPEIARTVDLIGLDYYHARREHRTIKRRSLYLAGTFELPYAPELGVGAPPWFTPLAHEDSLFCAMCALAYGVRGFNLYMAVDRDRWYGAPIDAQGTPRVEAGAWKNLLGKLAGLRFHDLERRVEVGLVIPREYARLSRATHALGPFSPSLLEALGGTPVDACREDALGFAGPVQVLWWRMLARFADALTRAGVPYVYVDSDADESRLARLRAVITPAYEFASSARWKKIAAFASHGGTVIYGPAMPGLDDQMRPHPFEVPRTGQRVLIDTPADAEVVVRELVEALGLARPFAASPAPVETAVHEDARGPRVLFVIHPAEGAVQASIALPHPMRLVDALSGEAFTGEDHVTVPLAPLSCRMFLLEPQSTSIAADRRRPRLVGARRRAS